jgi:hypothetical protein
MLSHQGYYQPLLEAFHVDTDLSQQAIDSANGRQDEQQQQQQQRGESAGQPGGQQQQQARPPSSTAVQ